MPKALTTEFKVGLTVIVATAILILGIIWGKELRLQLNKYTIEVTFDKIGGMVVGDPVTVSGVKEGKVKNIAWKDRRVLCELEIDDHVQLYEDATFTIVSAEILAGMQVEIDPGQSDRHINLAKQPFHGKYGGRIVDVGLIIGDLATEVSALTVKLDRTVTEINRLLENEGFRQNIQHTMASMDELTSDMRGLPSELKITLNNLDTLISRLNHAVGENRQEFNTSLRNLNRLSMRLDTTTNSLQGMMNRIENREGTLGRMVYDSTLYINLSRTLQRVDSLAQKIKNDGLDIDLF